MKFEEDRVKSTNKNKVHILKDTYIKNGTANDAKQLRTTKATIKEIHQKQEEELLDFVTAIYDDLGMKYTSVQVEDMASMLTLMSRYLPLLSKYAANNLQNKLKLIALDELEKEYNHKFINDIK